MGLHFPRERWDDLQRGLAGAAREFGFDDPATCADWLLSTPLTRPRIEILANHLTIGETYFFREKDTLRALSDEILPELIRSRRGRDQRLRLWSAACCSGEEPYTLAILLHRILPDLEDWDVTITGTDINAGFLRKAVAGVYGEWSFRDAPPGLRERYFTPVAGGRYSVIPSIRKLVNFTHLNLAQQGYPSLETGTNAMDVIFCRNVLMYFTAEQIGNVIGNLRLSLVDGGWLVVSPSEASKALFPRFASVDFPGAIFFRKIDQPEPPKSLPTQVPLTAEPFREWPAPVVPVTPEIAPGTLSSAEALYEEGKYESCASALLEASGEEDLSPARFSLLIRALANQGRISDARLWCERWVAADKMNAASHYLRAVVLVEDHAAEEARVSLQRAIYLDPGFVLAHFALGNLARTGLKSGQADKHFATALRLLHAYEPDDLVPESEGLAAGRLAQTIASIASMESGP